MLRKVIAVVTLVIGLVAGSVLVASARTGVDPQANLRQGQNVLPGTGRAFEIQVSNGVLEPVDWVSITLPASAGITPSSQPVSAPDGWTATVINTSNVKALRFKTTSAPIARAGTLSFKFPADVARPAATDKTGTFGVTISGDQGATTTDAAGALTSTVRILQVHSLRASSPAGVTDQSTTAGQSIKYNVAVTNHAAQAVSVTPRLTSSGSDTIGTAGPASIASGAAHTFSFPITLGTASGTRTLSASATATNAEAVSKTAALTVQTRALISFNRATFTPSFVRSDAPIPYTFSVQANKSGEPALTLSSCTLSFAGTKVGASGVPLTLGAGTDSTTLKFGPTTVIGSEKTYDAQVSCTGTDANGKPESPAGTLTNVVTIDNTRPVVTLDPLGIPSGQDAVKNGDTITISGDVFDNAATTLDAVRLRTDRGQIIACPKPTRNGGSFSCTVSDVRFDVGTTAVFGEAQATDTAGNFGGGLSDQAVVDLFKPALHFAETEEGSEAGDQIRVQFDESPAGRVIRGGCDPSRWTVAGQQVLAVQYSDGSACRPGQAGPSGGGAKADNYRILVLAAQLETDETPEVTYTPSQSAVSDNVRDGAGHQAEQLTVTAVTGFVPAAPDIMRVTRSDHRTGEREDATADGAGTKAGTVTYWTNRSGSDLLVEFAGSKAGYQVQVVDGDGNPVTAQQSLSGVNGTVAVPIGSTDRRVVRGIQLINSKGPGAIAYFDVVLDRVAPRIDTATASKNAITGETQAAVRFTEALAFGRNFASDWFLLAANGYAYQSNGVTGSGAQRTLTSKAFTGEFGGVEYYLTPAEEAGGAVRYEDRAGNLLANAAWGSV